MVKMLQGENQNNLKKGDILFTASSEDKEGVGLCSEVEFSPEESLYLNSFCFGLRPEVGIFATGFAKHIFRSSSIKKKIEASSNGVTRINLSKKLFGKVKIPIPPLQIQKEIVNILDKFTQLEAELEAELEAREKQYEEVRRRLLDFESDTSNHPLGEMIREMCPEGVTVSYLSEEVVIKNGSDYKHLGSGSVPVFGSGGIIAHVDGFKANQPSVLIPRKGSIGNLFFVDTPFWTVDTIFYTQIGPRLEAKFFFYFLKTKDLTKLNFAGGVPSLTQSILSKIRLPIPPLEIQKEIVRILDNLDALVNSVNEGIPAEIAARRKQYEHYRDKLLTFKELDAA
jgi:type I restriction enzyme S subunit